MEIERINMDPLRAREAWRNYSKQIARLTKDDEILRRGYKHLAQKKPILDLYAALRKLGLDNHGRPKIAIARANWEKVWLDIYEDGRLDFAMDRWARVGTHQCVVVPAGIMPTNERQYNLTARVPAIPPVLKPRGSLRNYHILWDADWTQEPPHDPILLRHLGRNIYAVLAAWDLTLLERALLR